MLNSMSRQLCFCFLWVFIGISIVRATDISIEKVGELHLGGNFIGCEVVGTRLYLIDEWGLNIYDVSKPDHIFKTGEVAIPGFNTHVIVSGNYAYVSNTYEGVEIVDISDPAHPRFVHEIDLNLRRGWVYSLQKIGNMLYVNAISQLPPDITKQAVYVIDATDPLNAKVLYNIQHDAQFAEVRGNFLYLLRFDRLTTFDISDPVWPRATSVISLFNQTEVALEIMGDYLYITGGSEGVLVFSLQNPAQPKRIGYIGESFRSFNAVAEGNTLAAYESGQGIRLIDISNPANPQQKSFIPSFSVWCMTIANKSLYFSDNDYHLQIWDISKPEQPVFLGKIPGMKFWLGDVAVYGRYAYVTDMRSGLLVIDVLDPQNPKNVAALPLRYEFPYYGAFKMAIWLPLIYVTCGQYLFVIDIHQPTQPKILAELYLGSYTQGIDIDTSGDIVYVGTENGNLIIVNAHDRTVPIAMETVYIGPGRIRDVVVRENYIYLAREDNGILVLEQIKRNDLTEVRHIAELDTQGFAESLALYRDKILLADAYSGLTIIDASKIDSLSVSAVKPSEGRENVVSVIAGYGILGTDDDMQVWDLRSPEIPRLASIRFPSWIHGICARGNWIYVASESAFQIIRMNADPFVDLDNDKHTNLNDVKKLLEYRVGNIPSMDGLVNADLNIDNQVTAYDAVLLLNTIIGLPLPPLEIGITNLKFDSQTRKDNAIDVSITFTGSPVWATELVISFSSGEMNLLPSSIIWNLPEGAITAYSLNRLKDRREFSLAFASPVPISMDQPFVTFAIGSSGIRKCFVGIDYAIINDYKKPIFQQIRLEFESVATFDLLPPFPNPSMQEVWIPFNLLEDADVKVRIYKMDGQLVRRLDLDSQKAGLHIRRNDSAYWDGMDTLGQKVSSGVYFCQVSASGFSNIRKITILR